MRNYANITTDTRETWIFPLLGQSNMVANNSGPINLGGLYDTLDYKIKQISRAKTNTHYTAGTAGTILLAQHPIQHGGLEDDNAVGLSLTFAKKILELYPTKVKQVVLVGTALGSSGFGNSQWNPGDPAYNNAVSWVNAAVTAVGGGAVVKGIIWHQGESDANATHASSYSGYLHTMAVAFRTAIGVAKETPIITGTMLQSWVNDSPTYRNVVNLVLLNPQSNGISYSKGVDLRNITDAADTIHFGADGLRDAGIRYAEAYKAYQDSVSVDTTTNFGTFGFKPLINITETR